MINVLLVDDHELVRAGIRRILEDIKGIKVAGEACC
ncbi:two-component system response regulator UvrY, partial [Klebsiella pneumoniae]